MYSKINSQGSFITAVTLAEAKSQLNILSSNTMDDGYITSLIHAAVDLAQTFTHRLLTQGSVSIRHDGYCPVIPLPYGEPTAITEIIVDDTDITADTDLYELDEITEKLTIKRQYSKLKVTYDCGYTSLPQGVKQGILMLITNMYEQRSDYVTGMTVEQISTTACDLLGSVKYYAT